LKLDKKLNCPKCSGNNFLIKRQATYLYTYKVDLNNINNLDSLPFLFDNREKTDSQDYIQCENCGSTYKVKLENYSDPIDVTILQKAIRCDTIENPEFLG
jgi:transcription elongation factor Elf1